MSYYFSYLRLGLEICRLQHFICQRTFIGNKVKFLLLQRTKLFAFSNFFTPPESNGKSVYIHSHIHYKTHLYHIFTRFGRNTFCKSSSGVILFYYILISLGFIVALQLHVGFYVFINGFCCFQERELRKHSPVPPAHTHVHHARPLSAHVQPVGDINSVGLPDITDLPAAQFR